MLLAREGRSGPTVHHPAAADCLARARDAAREIARLHDVDAVLARATQGFAAVLGVRDVALETTMDPAALPRAQWIACSASPGGGATHVRIVLREGRRVRAVIGCACHAPPPDAMLDACELLARAASQHLATLAADARAATGGPPGARDAQVLGPLFASNLIGVRVAERSGRILEANDEFLRILGYTRDELAGFDWWSATAPESLAETRRATEELERRGRVGPFEKTYRRRDGTLVPVLVGFAQVDDDPARSIGFVLDLTEQRRSESRLRMATEAARLGFYEHDLRSGRITVCDEARRLLGIPADAPVATREDVYARIDPEDVATIRAHPGLSVTPQRFAIEFRVRDADGGVRWLEARGESMAEPQPEGRAPAEPRPVRSAGVLMDVTIRKRMHEALQASESRQREINASLVEADRRKNEFLAMLAHELRNPLAPIANGVEILRVAPPDGPVAVGAREIIGRQVRHLARLVDDLLDVARITRGRIELKREPLDFRSVVSAALETAQPMITGRGHRCRLDLAAEPLPVAGDRLRLAQVVGNLLNNAAKYTGDGGEIDVVARRRGERVHLVVRDNGIGMPPELLAQVFELFAQGSRSLDRSEGGLGIGLSLVRSLVEMHGGVVHAASDGPGRGSVFTIELPLVA
jgi:PAS domain S-box-containing protein